MVKKIDEIRAKSDDQLKEDVVALRKEGLNLRFQQASGELKNVARRRVVRREVAMIKTVLGQRADGTSAPKAEKLKEKK